MSKSPINNRFITGFILGLVLPIIVFLLIYLFSDSDISLKSYLARIIGRNSLARLLSLSVFANLILFLAFNRFDKLKSSRGVLGITLLWALTVLYIKLFV